MKKGIAFILILSLFINGCAYKVMRNENENSRDFYERINKICMNNERLSIKTNYGQIYLCNNLQIAEDSTDFFNLASNRNEKISTDKINEIEFEENTAGIFEGLTFGALAGGGLTAIFYPTVSGEGNQGRAIAILGGIVIGGLAGVLFNHKSKTIIKISE